MNNDEEIVQNALSMQYEAWVKRQWVPSCGRGCPDQVNKPLSIPLTSAFNPFLYIWFCCCLEAVTLRLQQPPEVGRREGCIVGMATGNGLLPGILGPLYVALRLQQHPEG